MDDENACIVGCDSQVWFTQQRKDQLQQVRNKIIISILMNSVFIVRPEARILLRLGYFITLYIYGPDSIQV